MNAYPATHPAVEETNMHTDITDDQIRKLRAGAAEAGDLAMVEICDLAIDTRDPDHRASCAEVIREAEARAMED